MKTIHGNAGKDGRTTRDVVAVLVVIACMNGFTVSSVVAATKSSVREVSFQGVERRSEQLQAKALPEAARSSDVAVPSLLAQSLGELSESVELDEEESQRPLAEQDWATWIQPERLGASLQLVATMTLVGLIPALLLMTTSYIRITIVLSLLRQAFGSQQLIPAQVTTSLAMLCTGLIMWPTWQTVYQEAIVPWSQSEDVQSVDQLWKQGVVPIQQFMIRQIDTHGNAADVHLFLKYAGDEAAYPTSYDQVPMRVLMPAFLLSELKTAFLIGFRVYLPFLVIDLVVASITTAMGMFMLPPATVSLPLKLLLFVMADGWRYVIEMLLMSFR